MSGKPVKQTDWLQRRIELYGIKRSGYVVSPSQAMLSIVEKEAGKPFKRTSVIPYPLDPAMLEEAPAPAEKPSGKKVILFAARNDLVKGADVLVKAIPLIISQVPEAEFWLFGYVPGLGENALHNARFFPFLPKKELFRYYHATDLVVVPSRWDNSPNTVYEAMAAGKAVVASKVGGIPEFSPGPSDRIVGLSRKCRRTRLGSGHPVKG